MILWTLRRAKVVLWYALCRYDGSGGEDRANKKISGNCGIYRLCFIVRVDGETLSTHTCRYRTDPEPPWVRIVQSHASGRRVVCPLHVGISHSKALDPDTLPCSAVLYVYQAFSSSMSYAANEVVVFRFALPD